jgi:excisionase family DNA binding protein
MQAVTITQITPPELETLIENSLKKILTSQKPEQPQPETDQLLTIQQVAELLSLSVPTIYGLVSRSEIPCMKKGKRLYFSKQELTDWIKTGRKKTLAEIDSEADAYLLTKKKGGK